MDEAAQSTSAGSESRRPMRALTDQTFSRVTGAPLVAGNTLRLLKDAGENYPAWLAAIHSAERTIHFESYMIYEDEIGFQFADALIAKVRQGVRVRLLYDWMGDLGVASRKFWQHLRAGNVDVRCYNPPRLDSPLGWLSRDHRKSIVVDGSKGFVTGLCVGKPWAGDPAKGKAPWRDTGVEIEGPAVADVAQAFADVWAATGDPLPTSDIPTRDGLPQTGDVSLRVVPTVPRSTGLYRLDQFIAASARRTLWLTDAYFAGTISYVDALCEAAQDDVDVRLLVPGSSDVPIVQAISRASYRPLLEAGVRVFEWNGPMMHAKSAVADNRWARVGSTNLNVASWLGNYELDVVIENEDCAQNVARMYEEDLRNTTEIVLSRRNRVRPSAGVLRSGAKLAGRRTGSLNRAAAGGLSIGRTIGAAVTNRRPLGAAEAKIMAGAGAGLLVLILLTLFLPLVVIVPLAVIGGWIAIALLIKAYELWSVQGSVNQDTPRAGAQQDQANRSKRS